MFYYIHRCEADGWDSRYERRDVFEEKIQVANNRGNLALLLLTSREWFSNCKTAVWRKWGLQRETLLHHFSFKGVLVLEVASTSKRKPQWHISNHQPGSSSLLIYRWMVCCVFTTFRKPRTKQKSMLDSFQNSIKTLECSWCQSHKNLRTWINFIDWSSLSQTQ